MEDINNASIDITLDRADGSRCTISITLPDEGAAELYDELSGITLGKVINP